MLHRVECAMEMADLRHPADDEPEERKKESPDDGALPPERQPKPRRAAPCEVVPRRYVRPTSPNAQISTGIDSKNRNGKTAPSPKCDSKPIVMIGTAKTVTGLANNIRKARPNRSSKCIKPIAMKDQRKGQLDRDTGPAGGPEDAETDLRRRQFAFVAHSFLRPTCADLNPETRG